MCENLFYIDDNEYEHLIVESLIKNYTDCKNITCFLNGRDALDRLEKNKSNPDGLPDVMLVDIFMPEFSGWEFLDEFKGLYPNLSKKIIVYILSSTIDRGDIEHAKRYSFVKSCITKPLTQTMVEKIGLA
jgi:CheY-like chemotaxis protein